MDWIATTMCEYTDNRLQLPNFVPESAEEVVHRWTSGQDSCIVKARKSKWKRCSVCQSDRALGGDAEELRKDVSFCETCDVHINNRIPSTPGRLLHNKLDPRNTMTCHEIYRAKAGNLFGRSKKGTIVLKNGHPICVEVKNEYAAAGTMEGSGTDMEVAIV